MKNLAIRLTSGTYIQPLFGLSLQFCDFSLWWGLESFLGIERPFFPLFVNLGTKDCSIE